MKNIWGWLRGKKSYLLSGFYIGLNLAEAGGYISPASAKVVEGVVLGLLGMSIRSAVSKRS